MKNLKNLVMAGAVIAVFAIAIMIYMVSHRQKNEIYDVDGRTATSEHDFYVIEDNELGYRFTMSDEFFRGYQEQKQGYYSLYTVPFTDSTNDQTSVFAVVVVPKTKAAEYKKLCDTGKETAPKQCVNYSQTGWSNNLYYFNIEPRDDTYFTTTGKQADMDKLEAIMAEVKKTFRSFDIPSAPTTLTYEDQQAGYSFQYPAELDRGIDEALPLNIPENFGIDRDPTFTPGLAKTIPVRYCAPSGRCLNTTINYVVEVGNIELTEKDLLKTKIGPSLIKYNYNGSTLYLYNEGAEGEGINWTFVIPGSSEQMIVFAHRYIDENILINYKTVKDFTPYAQQKQNVMEMINSLRFQQPLNDK